MAKIKYRKKRPQPPKYYWSDTDNCWACKDRNNCNGCKFLKRYVAVHNKNNPRKHEVKMDS